MQAVTERVWDSIAVEGLEVRARRGRVLVSAFSWRHEAGNVAWLVGENGTGKSSLLRVLAGCAASSAGTVKWQMTSNRLRYYSPAMSVPGDFTVNDWMSFVLSTQRGIENDPAEELLPKTADPGRRFQRLSTGEAKRYLLWSLLRSYDGPLVLDEPYEHLSAQAKAALTVALRAIARTSVVIVATNQDVSIAGEERLLTLDGTQIQVAS